MGWFCPFFSSQNQYLLGAEVRVEEGGGGGGERLILWCLPGGNDLDSNQLTHSYRKGVCVS